jgi:predicted AAA+ superfamily ATPase
MLYSSLKTWREYQVNMEPLVDEQEQSNNGLQAPTTREQLHMTLQAVQGLGLLRAVLRDKAGEAVLELLQALSLSHGDATAVVTSYSRAFYELAAMANEEATPRLADAWQAYLAARLIDDRNPWSEQVERVGPARVSPTLRAQARRDLRALQRLFCLDARSLREMVNAVVASSMPALRDALTPWSNLAPRSLDVPAHARDILAARIAACGDWTTLVEPLEQHWARHGTGPQARYHVLRWSAAEQALTGIVYPDPIRLTSLVGQERQQERLTQNIERFLAGLPAQDMLLYGPPGTGKSSTVKALVNAYADQGLCLVEVSKEDIGDLPVVVAQLRERAPHYLLFIDDLSFEEHETAYKALKVMLEGTAEARPANVLICATSNRLNLIRENFSDRGKPTEDVNWRDTMDEKQSLAHRFALRVTFISPDQRQYLRIVEALAHQRGLELPLETLQERALHWERQHTGRSGRLARQFIDDLEAELKYR